MTNEFMIPELFYYEVFSVCMRRHTAPKTFADNGMSFLLKIPLTRVPMTQKFMKFSGQFVAMGLTGYDATYASLAKCLSGVWLTFDLEAARKLGNPPWVRSPAE